MTTMDTQASRIITITVGLMLFVAFGRPVTAGQTEHAPQTLLSQQSARPRITRAAAPRRSVQTLPPDQVETEDGREEHPRSTREWPPQSSQVVSASTRLKNQLVSFSHTPHRGGYIV